MKHNVVGAERMTSGRKEIKAVSQKLWDLIVIFKTFQNRYITHNRDESIFKVGKKGNK